jgi:hypothetical protein
MRIIEKNPKTNFHVSLINHNKKEKEGLFLIEYWDVNKDWIGSLSGITKQELHNEKLIYQEKIRLIKSEMKKDKDSFHYYKEKLERAQRMLSELNRHGGYSVWLDKESFDEQFEVRS